MIDSVLSQSFTDYEIVIVNDGSTDDSWDILKEFERENIQVINSEHKGPSAARNAAISHAKAPIILNLDADDKISSGLLQKGFDVFSVNENAGIVFSDCEFFGARNKKYNPGEYDFKSMLRNNRIISAAFFKKEDWASVNGYSDVFLYGLEDWDLWLSIINLGRDIIKIPGSTVYYRTYINPSDSRSGRRKSDRLKAQYSLLMIYKRHMNLYSTFPEFCRRLIKLEDQMRDENMPIRKLRDLVFHYKQRLNNYLTWTA
jgi:glycosyltransferase involved in cell wall biosynthesis